MKFMTSKAYIAFLCALLFAPISSQALDFGSAVIGVLGAVGGVTKKQAEETEKGSQFSAQADWERRQKEEEKQRIAAEEAQKKKEAEKLAKSKSSGFKSSVEYDANEYLKGTYQSYITIKATVDVLGPDAAMLCDRKSRMKNVKKAVKRIEQIIVKKYPSIDSKKAWNEVANEVAKVEEYQNLVRIKGQGRNDYQGAQLCVQTLEAARASYMLREKEAREKFGVKSAPVKGMSKDF